MRLENQIQNERRQESCFRYPPKRDKCAVNLCINDEDSVHQIWQNSGSRAIQKAQRVTLSLIKLPSSQEMHMLPAVAQRNKTSETGSAEASRKCVRQKMLASEMLAEMLAIRAWWATDKNTHKKVKTTWHYYIRYHISYRFTKHLRLTSQFCPETVANRKKYANTWLVNTANFRSPLMI